MPLFRTQIFGCESVADAAAKAKKSILFDFPKHSATVRASERGRLTQTFLTGYFIHVEFRNASFFSRCERRVAESLGRSVAAGKGVRIHCKRSADISSRFAAWASGT